MSHAADTALRRESFPAAWLATRLRVEPTEIEALRRAGELLGVRPLGELGYVYPAWQFDGAGRPLAIVARVVRAAREAGRDDRALYELLLMRDGLTSGQRLVDALRNGGAERVIAVIRSGRSSESEAVKNR